MKSFKGKYFVIAILSSTLQGKLERQCIEVNILKQQLSGLREQENHLTLVPGYTGNIAKDVDA